MVTTVTDNSPQSINTSLFSLDKDIQEIKKVTDKLTGISTEANVISVNGKQGIVELNASDVNALPDTTVIPTTTSELENTSGFITSSDSITGNAATATRAEQDADGNVITDTYATKELIANETSERKTADEALQTQITANKSAIDTLNGTGTGSVKKTVTDEIAKVVANAPEDFDTLKEISDWIDTHEDSASAMNTQIQANAEAIAGKADKVHTHTKSQITDFPTSLPANGGTADSANVPTGFERIGVQELWGNQDGVFITDWQTFTGDGGRGDISFRFNHGRLNAIIDGVFYQNEGRYKLVDEDSIKTIMKPNYTTGRFPNGAYSSGETVSVSATITTTRGNPVFISYSGDYNSVNHGSTVPWISFELFVDGQIVQRTVVDNSSAIISNNTSFAGNALTVLSAGSHTIRLDAVLRGDASGQIQFQEQDNIVNLVAFEL